MLSTTKFLVFVFIISTIGGAIIDVNSRSAASCNDWYKTQGDPEQHLKKTLKPPCRIPSSFPKTLIDGWTTDPGCDGGKKPGTTCSYHGGARGCYRHSYQRTGPGAQACYDNDGNWISDPWKGAGTLDVETAIGSLIQQFKHYTADVRPFDDCCPKGTASEQTVCGLYYEKRPPGQCEDKPAV